MKIRGEDGIPFKLNPQLASRLKSPVVSSLNVQHSMVLKYTFKSLLMVILMSV